MTLIFASSPKAQAAQALVIHLQKYLQAKLDLLPPAAPAGKSRFKPVEWARAGGRFGGGVRLVADDPMLFNRASINISQVHYEGDESKALGSASALSTIMHPGNPFAPSMHMHISFTEMKNGTGYWRVMADLNPSISFDEDRAAFEAVLAKAAGKDFAHGKEQGDRYFFIPALKRHRGVAHFYLENFRGGTWEEELEFARKFGEAVAGIYAEIVTKRWSLHPDWKDADREKQLAYHSLYFLQVLTLDRGTTSGLLVHDENDVGILGSLPSHVNTELLRAWLVGMPALQAELMLDLLGLFPGEKIAAIGDAQKKLIAGKAREFYRKNPAAQDLLARGDVVPPTQTNHSGRS